MSLQGLENLLEIIDGLKQEINGLTTEVSGLRDRISPIENHCTSELDNLEEENENLRRLLDIETLRMYHRLSFLDPPSYHEEIPEGGSLWDCPTCVERYIERATKFLDRS